ncbi:MAG: hypothetical protein WKF88_03180 [Ferruginibacter sp.]
MNKIFRAYPGTAAFIPVGYPVFFAGYGLVEKTPFAREQTKSYSSC